MTHEQYKALLDFLAFLFVKYNVQREGKNYCKTRTVVFLLSITRPFIDV